jgi:hypothetical protein
MQPRFQFVTANKEYLRISAEVVRELRYDEQGRVIQVTIFDPNPSPVVTTYYDVDGEPRAADEPGDEELDARS